MVLLLLYIHQNLSKCVQTQRNPNFVQVNGFELHFVLNVLTGRGFRDAGNISDDTNTVTSFIKKCTEDTKMSVNMLNLVS